MPKDRVDTNEKIENAWLRLILSPDAMFGDFVKGKCSVSGDVVRCHRNVQAATGDPVCLKD